MRERRIVSIATGQARRLAQLSAFAYDIDEAHDALQTALAMDVDDPAQASVRSHLITAGVIAYFRCFAMRKNKPSMEGKLKLSEESLATHEWARLWRNRLVAHSDSEMKRTLAFVMLARFQGTVVVEEAFAMTLGVAMPAEKIEAFFALVVEVKGLLEYHRSNQTWRTEHALSDRAIGLLWERPESLGGLGESDLMRWDPAAEQVVQEIAVTVPQNAVARSVMMAARQGK
jgi:hypothetical protein